MEDNGFFFYRNNISLLLTSFPIPNVNANEHSGRISFTAEIEPLSSCSSGWLFNLFGEQLYLVKGTGNKQKETATTTRPSVVFVRPSRSVNGKLVYNNSNSATEEPLELRKILRKTVQIKD